MSAAATHISTREQQQQPVDGRDALSLRDADPGDRDCRCRSATRLTASPEIGSPPTGRSRAARARRREATSDLMSPARSRARRRAARPPATIAVAMPPITPTRIAIGVCSRARSGRGCRPARRSAALPVSPTLPAAQIGCAVGGSELEALRRRPGRWRATPQRARKRRRPCPPARRWRRYEAQARYARSGFRSLGRRPAPGPRSRPSSAALASPDPAVADPRQRDPDRQQRRRSG